jgi:hypothetical protein
MIKGRKAVIGSEVEGSLLLLPRLLGFPFGGEKDHFTLVAGTRIKD